MINIPELCESCGKVVDPITSPKDLEQSFTNDERKKLGICSDCFNKRYKISTKKRSGYGGTIYELEEKAAPRFGVTKMTCLKCNWVAWTEEGLRAHIEKRHSD